MTPAGMLVPATQSTIWHVAEWVFSGDPILVTYARMWAEEACRLSP
jgi:hypothetical protein